MKEELLDAATDITYFKAHRCRAASSRKADQIGKILITGCWKRGNTFQNFCYKGLIDNLQDFDHSSAFMTKNMSKEK